MKINAIAHFISHTSSLDGDGESVFHAHAHVHVHTYVEAVAVNAGSNWTLETISNDHINVPKGRRW